MSVEVGETIFAALQKSPAVVALVADRIFPDEAPEGETQPLIVYQVITDVPDNSFTEAASSRRKFARLQVDCYARAEQNKPGRYRLAHQIATAVENVIANMADPDFSAALLDSRDLYDNVTTYARVSLDFTVFR